MAKKKKLIRLMENFSEDIIMEIMLRLPVKSTVSSVGEKEKSSKVLLSFDIADERFLEISQPDEKWEKFDYKFVGVVGERLCMLCSVSKVGFEVWVMNDYGIKESWTKLFQIDQVTRPLNYLRNIVDLGNGEILLDDEKSNNFILYDPNKKLLDFNRPVFQNSTDFQSVNRRNIFVYMESLVSVNSGTHVGDKQERLDYCEAIKGLR
ncbi:F-box/kelch-repeat protein At3g06240-like [Papaver somniferum]|uniref:F-box/kelch-repeat protein At3g06240-like n=1 Tax=Papaver somniferum TaxID=3469 RepID=UPI000E6FD01B|nr:F-box/kelch-repeat protein At3g06240-like [Papaver somniferum]